MQKQLSQKPWKNIAYWLNLLDHSVCFFIQSRTTFLELSMPTECSALPCQSLMKMPYSLVYDPIWWRNFLSSSFFFLPDDQRIVNLTKTEPSHIHKFLPSVGRGPLKGASELLIYSPILSFSFFLYLILSSLHPPFLPISSPSLSYFW